jgi:hypothetical protein
MIGLCGSHRSGKTTLAKEYAKKNGILFVETSVSKIFRELGYDPAAKFDFSTRLMIQEEVLKRVDAIYSEIPLGVEAITDRTPLDMLAYTKAEAIGDSVSEKDQKRFAAYSQACIDVANKRFTSLVVVQPGIPLVHEEGKAAMNIAYIEHLNTLILGLSVDERVNTMHFYIPRHLTDMEDRITALEYAVGRTKRVAHEAYIRYREAGNSLH